MWCPLVAGCCSRCSRHLWKLLCLLQQQWSMVYTPHLLRLLTLQEPSVGSQAPAQAQEQGLQAPLYHLLVGMVQA